MQNFGKKICQTLQTNPIFRLVFFSLILIKRKFDIKGSMTLNVNHVKITESNRFLKIGFEELKNWCTHNDFV